MRKFGNEVNTNNARNANNTKQSTLPKFQTLAKCVPLKVTYLSYRKETEKNGRELRGNLMKKCYEKGGSSL
jgi:hypothetical protein